MIKVHDKRAADIAKERVLIKRKLRELGFDGLFNNEDPTRKLRGLLIKALKSNV